MMLYGLFNAGGFWVSEAHAKAYYEKLERQIVEAGHLEAVEAELGRYGEIKDEFYNYAKPVEMLFGLESVMGRCWGDVGFLEFFIRQEDLAAGRFEDTYCDVLST